MRGAGLKSLFENNYIIGILGERSHTHGSVECVYFTCQERLTTYSKVNGYTHSMMLFYLFLCLLKNVVLSSLTIMEGIPA